MTDRNVQFPDYFHLEKVPGTEDIFKITPAPGEVAAEGTFLNKANLLSDETGEEIFGDEYDQSQTVNDALRALYETARRGGGMNTFQAMMGGIGVEAMFQTQGGT